MPWYIKYFHTDYIDHHGSMHFYSIIYQWHREIVTGSFHQADQAPEWQMQQRGKLATE
jgi:hypothetical protein